MVNSFYFTLGQAAKETGLSKSTLFKAIKSGKLSYIEKNKSGYKIDPAELFRVFNGNTKIVSGNTQSERLETPGNGQETDYLKRENELLRKQIEREREQIEDLKADRDFWRQQATHLLTHQPISTESSKSDPIISEDPRKSPLWVKLFGRFI
jgi:hypothetical protein